MTEERMKGKKDIRVREIQEEDRRWVRDLIKKYWMSEVVVSRGRIYHADQLSGFITTDRGNRVGLITYRIENDQCEIMTLNALYERRGIGRALIDAVRTDTEKRHCKRIWLVTTNDNVPARCFYEKCGFTVAAIHHNAMEVSRKLKPEIPLLGVDDVPIRDEIEFAMQLLQPGL